ncbi:MAG: YraN family protein [Pseudomonadota bacterium]
MTDRSRIERRRRVADGFAAEDHVERHLAKKGFSCLSRRFKVKEGEVDLVVKRSNLIVFVEVKKRKSLSDGLFSITPRAQKRISAAASLWIAENPDYHDADSEFRFDAAIVLPDGTIEIVEHAFSAS